MPRQLLDRVAQTHAFAAVLRRLSEGGTRKHPLVFAQTDPAAFSFLIAMLATCAPKRKRVWVVAHDLPLQERLVVELPIWKMGEVLFLPESDPVMNKGITDPDLAAERLEALRLIEAPPEKLQFVIVTETALHQSAPTVHTIDSRSICLTLGDDFPPERLLDRFVNAGFERTEQVTERGQWSMRGGIIDVFPLQSPHPIRLEFFGDTLESIRAFDADSQISFERYKRQHLILEEPRQDAELHTWISEEDWVVSTPQCVTESDVVLLESPVDAFTGPLKIETKYTGDELAFRGLPVGSFDTGDFVMQEARRRQVIACMQDWKRKGWLCSMFIPQKGEEKRFLELCGDDPAWEGLLRFRGDLPQGFSVPEARLVVLSSAELFGRHTPLHARRRADREEKARRERAQVPLREIEPDDLVIHASHGLGRFLGIMVDEASGEEELHIEYKGGVILRIPLRQAHLVSKYVGLGTKTPELNRLGDSRWARTCKAAEQAVADYAAQLLEIQAERDTRPGCAHPADSSWMREFEESFPYRETPDQLRAILQTKTDMESVRPMDRLICGDVGFGKTEVAIRAAFKCITGGKQVAVLAPTTVLVNQHGRTFRQRMSEYPVRIETLSRLTPPKQLRAILRGIEDGSVDIVIGTHRLISQDVRFHNLGLAVIDEEQRFGVRHKDLFKKNFRFVDMLTLSATPIPRTLYFALMGARDMSSIDTPPPNRIPVQTDVCPYDESLIREAVERELKRKGQVFFLHNRVQTIGHMAATLHKLVPFARIVIGHGQMDKGELEEVMQKFISGEADVLLSTSIIESGIDIPNANTIIINRADRFGLADLYQLRGRVGRSGHRAYACLLLPNHAFTTGDARKRVNAIKQYTELGSGFKIAMRDLEIRGAGNLLGTRQSGHIAAIGFELYCQLLRQSIERLQGKSPSVRAETTLKADFLCWSEAIMKTQEQPPGTIGVYIPIAWLESTRLRIAGYKDLADTRAIADVDELRRQWLDRFGALPLEAEMLLLCQKIKIVAAQARISQVEIAGQKLMLTRNHDFILLDKRFPRLKKRKPQEKLAETFELLETF